MASASTGRPIVFGVSVVRNEADVIAASVCNQLAIGIDRVLVLDTGSTDSTLRILGRLARSLPVSWTSHDGPFDQAALVTALVHEAARAGADWVVPFDADELWWPRDRRLKEVLGYAKAGAVRAEVVHFVQRRARRTHRPRGLLTMTMRPSRTLDPVAGMGAATRGEAATVEVQWPTKLAVRPVPGLELARGAHWASGLDGPEEFSPHLQILHAMFRARSQMDARAATGRRLRATAGGDDSWHLRRLAGLDATGLDAEWRANSYGRDGTLDLHGEPRALIADGRLRRAAAPWVVPLRRTRARRILAASKRG